MLLDVLLEVVLPVPAVGAIGGLVGRRLRFETATLSNAVFWLFSPALVFTSLSTIRLEGGEVARLTAVAVALFVGNAALGIGWARLRGADQDTRAVAAVTS